MNPEVTTTYSRIRQQGSFNLDISPAEAFHLFTAEGERLWVPGWSPEILGKTPQESGLVFLTGTGCEATIWTVIDSDPEEGRVRYSRVTPVSRAGLVEVRLEPEGRGSCVHVMYDLTALSSHGETALKAYEGANFQQMLEEWRRLISKWLDRRNAEMPLGEFEPT